MLRVSLRIGLAFGFRLVDAKRVELAHLVQEALLGRYRDEHLRCSDEDWLAYLTVPIADRKADTLEAGDVELRSLDVGEQFLEVGRLRAGGGFTDDADCEPCVVVDGTHSAIGQL